MYLILFNISLTNWFNCCWYVLILFVNIHSRYPRYPRYMTQWKSKKKTKIKLTALLFYLILFNISLTNWFNCVWYGCVNIHSPPPALDPICNVRRSRKIGGSMHISRNYVSSLRRRCRRDAFDQVSKMGCKLALFVSNQSTLS